MDLLCISIFSSAVCVFAQGCARFPAVRSGTGCEGAAPSASWGALCLRSPWEGWGLVPWTWGIWRATGRISWQLDFCLFILFKYIYIDVYMYLSRSTLSLYIYVCVLNLFYILQHMNICLPISICIYIYTRYIYIYLSIYIYIYIIYDICIYIIIYIIFFFKLSVHY